MSRASLPNVTASRRRAPARSLPRRNGGGRAGTALIAGMLLATLTGCGDPDDGGGGGGGGGYIIGGIVATR